jgi:hypothetical protein
VDLPLVVRIADGRRDSVSPATAPTPTASRWAAGRIYTVEPLTLWRGQLSQTTQISIDDDDEVWPRVPAVIGRWRLGTVTARARFAPQAP